MNATEVKNALRTRHAAGEWVCIDEAFGGWASAGGGIDLLAMGVWQTAKAPGLPCAGKVKHDYPSRNAEAWSEVDARNPIVAYEVKVSRSDMRRELYGYQPGANAKSWNTRGVRPWPEKAKHAIARSHYFMFAIPQGLLTEQELTFRSPQADRALWVPPEAGLVEVDEHGTCRVRVKAPDPRKPQDWTRHELAELLRRVEYTTERRMAALEPAEAAA